MSDYIDRECLVEHIHSCMENDRLLLTATKEEILQMVTDVPTSEPKTGKWIWKDRHIKRTRQANGTTADGEETVVSVHEDYIEQRPYCSECGKWNDSDYLNFCPNCGARMEANDE